MAELFKFRCFQCQKLIGAPASKLGKVVHCPKCGVELIVPLPEAEEPAVEESDSEAFRPEDLGLNLEIERLSPPSVASKPTRDPLEPSPIAFLETASAISEPSIGEIPNEPNPDAGDFPNEPNPADLPEPKVESLVPHKRGIRPSRQNEPTSRARDVVLPRTAATAWALFAIFALGFAFSAGLLIGHYLWK